MSEPASSRNNRWWENYAVRYLVPTMTGMFFLRCLQLSAEDFSHPYCQRPGAPNRTRSKDSEHRISWYGQAEDLPSPTSRLCQFLCFTQPVRSTPKVRLRRSAIFLR